MCNSWTEATSKHKAAEKVVAWVRLTWDLFQGFVQSLMKINLLMCELQVTDLIRLFMLRTWSIFLYIFNCISRPSKACFHIFDQHLYLFLFNMFFSLLLLWQFSIFIIALKILDSDDICFFVYVFIYFDIYFIFVTTLILFIFTQFFT